MIDLLPVGGLCNRMRAIDSAIALAEHVNMPLRITWVVDSEMCARFSDLFDPLPPPITILTKTRTPLWLQSARKRNLFIPVLLRAARRTTFFDHTEHSRLVNADRAELRLRRRLAIRSYERFEPNNTVYQLFKPIPLLRARIDELTRSFDAKTIGVHIRRTDNMIATARSPDHLFVEAMTEAIEQDPESSFFLATDSPETKAKFLRRFGSRMRTQHLNRDRSTVEGVQDGVVELYALSKTRRILGSYWSSFSHTAAHIGGIKEHTVRTNGSA
jgi:hypothetical protein